MLLERKSVAIGRKNLQLGLNFQRQTAVFWIHIITFENTTNWGNRRTVGDLPAILIWHAWNYEVKE